MSLSKLFQRIIWHNNTTPAINEDNLNAMSKAIDDIDDRVILIGDDVVTVIPQIQAYLEQAESIVEAVEELSQNPPYIGANGNWYVFDTTLEAYKDSGVDASITVDIADITMIAEGAQPYVTNTGTSTDPIFHLFLPRSPQGATGNGIANIAKTGTQGLVDTYTITMTDGTTYTFTVTNGQGIGDMTKAVYDSTNAVADAGGIKDYALSQAAFSEMGAKNLLPNTVVSQTLNGVTFTVNADGSISCSGTSTAEMWIAVNTKTPLDPTKEYILSGCPSGGDESNTYSLYASDDATVWKFDEGSGVSFTPTGANNTTVTIHIKNDINMTGKVFKPMLRLSSITDSTYEPYALTNQQLTPYALSQSNPNLLDNPWFTVNQRGVTSWTNYNGYTVDRWNIDSGNASISNGVLSHTGNLYQLLEDERIEPLLGKVVTASILKSDDSIESVTFTMPSSLTGEYVTYGASTSFCLLLRNGNVSQIMRINGSVAVKATKLELGSVSTLAMDTAPNYATELLKCQRYFLRVPNTGYAYASLGTGSSYQTNEVNIFVPTPSRLRTMPTVSYGGSFFIRGGGMYTAVTAIEAYNYSANGVTCLIRCTGATNNYCYELCTDNDARAYIDFSADL